ncbi:MAG: signal peptide peptidase SppA [Salinirussus sp.]
MSIPDRLRTLARIALVLVVAVIAAATGWFLFVDYPASLTDLLGMLVAVMVVAGGLQLGSRLSSRVFPSYTVAEVAVEGPITRDSGSSGIPRGPMTPGTDDIVEQIDAADADRAVEALLLKLNTPGGEVVPSEDIRRAAEEFDGPTIAYTQDLCASGGMWIASGCDEFWAREGSIVGSVGVIFAQFRVDELLDRLGVDYEGITSGEYKDALSPFRPMEDEHREYAQALSDAWYEQFVERVAQGTGMSEDAVRETEARIYLGMEAQELGMVDSLGDREVIEEQLEDEIDGPVRVEEFSPKGGLAERLRSGAADIAFALGAGFASRFGGEADGLRMR